MKILIDWLFSPLARQDRKEVLREAMILESHDSEAVRDIGKFVKRAFIFRERTGGTAIPHNPYDTDRYEAYQPEDDAA